ncbi:MAG: serine/threonine protein kinase [Polyangiales bacterium]
MTEGPKRTESQSRLGAIPGGRTFGPFVLDERIAIGGTADVFLAHRVNGQPPPRFVVKRLLASLRNDPDARAMFAEEAELHRRFRHPNIVECFETGAADGEPYLAMELVQGADLHRLMRLGQARKRPMAPPLATWIAREVLAGLSVVHGAKAADGSPLGIVHRDVSPSNVYVSTTGEVKLGDFGIARPANVKTPKPGSLGSAIRGKFAYLAPEQVASEPVDHRADLFALANILAEMMLGKPLFPGSGQLAVLLAIRDVRIDLLDGPSAIPLPLVQVLKKALSRDQAQRFPDADAFSAALAPFAWQDAGTARREVATMVRWARETSMQLRAVGEHPDQASVSFAPPMVSKGQPTAPDVMQATPLAAVPHRPAPSLKLDSQDFYGLGEEPKPPSVRPAPASDRVTAPFAPPPSYVRTTDGETIGPLPYAKLIELVVTGRIGGDDHVDFMGTGFVPLIDVDELSRHLAPRSTVTRQLTGPGTPDWQGFAAERYDDGIGGAIDPGIATALAFVAGRRVSGVLLAQQGVLRKEIYFTFGRVLHVASTDPGELIGEYLVSHGLLERTDLDFALAVLPRFNGRLGEALTGLGVIEPVAMFKALQEQGRHKITEMFKWSEGELSFYTGAQPGKVEFPLDLAVGPIIEGGVAAMLDDLHATARYKPWLDRRVTLHEVPASLRDAGWSPRVERALQLAEAPVAVRALLKTLTNEGNTPHDAVRAVESARVSRMLGWTP